MFLRSFTVRYLKSVSVFWCIVHSFQQVLALSEQKAKEYCQYDFFNASCGSPGGRWSSVDGVILMESAQYGRMHSGPCVSGNIGCSVDVLEFFDQRCSGRKQCSVYVSDPALHKLAPCSKEYTSYLEAKYSCLSVAGVVGAASGCPSRDGHITLSGRTEGYIASVPLTEAGHETGNCPWKIEAEPRQTIRLSLLSFGTRGSAGGDRGDRGAGRKDLGTDACYEIGAVRELDGPGVDQPTVFSICSENMRENVFYVSTANSVGIQLKPPEVLKALAPFIIKYEVLGCRTVKPPTGGYVKIDGNIATVRCNESKETWFLTCTGNNWLGHMGNCTDKSSITASHGDVASLVEENFPYGILLVVAIGVALGVLIGGVLLSCVAYYMKRQTRQHGYSEPTDWTKQMLEEMEAYNEAKRGVISPATVNPRGVHDDDDDDGHVHTTAGTATATPTAVGLVSSPVRTIDRGATSGFGPHVVAGCTCPKANDAYAARTVLRPGGGGGGTAACGPHCDQSRFLYEIPQFSN